MFISVMAVAQSTQEMNVIREVNQLRSNPKSFIAYIQDYKETKSNYKSNVDWNKVCDETIDFLKTCDSIDTLSFNQEYFNKLDTFQSFNGEHTCLFPKSGSENLYGSSNLNVDAREVVISLLIDAKVNDKGHRSALMNPNFKGTAVK